MSETPSDTETTADGCNVRSSDLLASGQQDADLPCNELCHKCGSSDVLREFLKKGNRREGPGIAIATPVKYEGPSLCGYRAIAERDFIYNKCRCCGYEWGSKPMTPAAWKKRANAEVNARGAAASQGGTK